MKLQLMFIFIDIFMLLTYAYLWLRSTVVRAMWQRSKLTN